MKEFIEFISRNQNHLIWCLCQKGTFKIFSEGIVYTVNAGDFFFCIFTSHAKVLDYSNNCEIIFLSEDATDIRFLSIMNPILPLLHHYRVNEQSHFFLPIEFYKKFELIHKKIKEREQELKIEQDAIQKQLKEYYNILAKREFILDLTIYVIKNFKSKTKKESFCQLSIEFKNYVNENCTKERGVSFYAKLFNLTDSNFTSKIKAATLKTPLEIITEITINKIKVDLMSPLITISNLIDKYNFKDASYLSLYFKKATGLTSTQFRKQFQTSISTETK